MEELRSETASHPTSRDLVVDRLLRKQTARKTYTGKPVRMLKGFATGEVSPPANDSDLLAFACAITALPAATKDAERFKPVLLECLDRAGNSPARSAIYRAASRLDELLHEAG